MCVSWGRFIAILMSDDGVLPEDWLARQIARLDEIEGDVATLSGRLAQIRTWTYAAHRPGWVKDAGHWQEQTRAVEDRLSDALHERLTQRFIDRRTAILMRRLRDDDVAQYRARRFRRGGDRRRDRGQAGRLSLRARSAGGRNSWAHIARGRAQGT